MSFLRRGAKVGLVLLVLAASTLGGKWVGGKMHDSVKALTPKYAVHQPGPKKESELLMAGVAGLTSLATMAGIYRVHRYGQKKREELGEEGYQEWLAWQR